MATEIRAQSATRKLSRARLALALILLFAVTLVFIHAAGVWVLPALPKIPGKVLETQQQDFGAIALGDNGCVLVNNTWNKRSAPANFSQDVFVTEIEGKKTPGWRWRSGWQFPPTVVSQPQIVCGDKPWDEARGLTSGFPFLADSRRLTADFDVRMHASGTYNMSFSLWAVRELPASRGNITHEIMIWMLRNNQVPAGKNFGSLAVAGRTFDVFVEAGHGDASGVNKNRWTYIAFVPRTPLMQGSLELTAFTNYLIAQKLMAPDAYLTSVEFGNEVTDGAGVVELRHFDLRF